jgi:hypothetical protein
MQPSPFMTLKQNPAPPRPLAAAAALALETEAPQSPTLQPPPPPRMEATMPYMPHTGLQPELVTVLPDFAPQPGAGFGTRVDALENALHAALSHIREQAGHVARLESAVGQLVMRYDASSSLGGLPGNVDRGEAPGPRANTRRKGLVGRRDNRYLMYSEPPDPAVLAHIHRQRQEVAREVFFKFARASIVKKGAYKYPHEIRGGVGKRIHEILLYSVMINQAALRKIFRPWASECGQIENSTPAERVDHVVRTMPDLWVLEAGEIDLGRADPRTLYVMSAREARLRGVHRGPVWTDPGWSMVPAKMDPLEGAVIADLDEFCAVATEVRAGRREWRDRDLNRPHEAAEIQTPDTSAVPAEGTYAFFTRLAEERRMREAEEEARKNRALVLDRDNGDWFIPGAEDEDEDED